MTKQPHTIGSSLAGYSPSKAAKDSEKANRDLDHDRGVMLLLGRLALHYHRPALGESQYKLVLEDMIADLTTYSLGQIDHACAAWRAGNNAFFPKSGQLIAIIKSNEERSIARRRALAEPYKTPQLEAPHVKLKSWREILAEKGRAGSSG